MINLPGFNLFYDSDNLFNEFTFLIPKAFVSPCVELSVAFFGFFFSFSVIFIIPKAEVHLFLKCEFYFS